ncbi:MAG: hypothetical protein ABIQ95_12065 [Bdellovibrionia bacterium]
MGKKVKILSIGFFSYLFLISVTNAAEASGPGEVLSIQPSSEIALNLAQIQFGPIMALQGGGSSYSLMVRYLPEYSCDRFALGLELAFSSFQNAGSATFAVTELGIHGSYSIDPSWSVRLLLGAQSWTGSNGVAFFVGPEAQYHFQFKELKWIEGLYLSYTPVFQTTLAHLLSAGVNLRF